jgi:transglutaminase-like putative cysteine protease
MSRTALCSWTALVIAALSVGVSLLRIGALGQETKMPPGPGNYRVALLVRCQSQGDARLLTASPLDIHHQHIYGEDYRSEQLYPKPTETRQGDRRQIIWTQRPLSDGPMEARYEFLCTIDVHRPNSSMVRVQKLVHVPPEPGEWLHAGPGIDPGHSDISEIALDLTPGLTKPIDLVHALFHFVDQRVRKEPAAGASSTALDCLQNGRGDALAKSRLLVALCRNRGIPARLVSGLILNKKSEQKGHVWAEAWVDGAWLAMCPYHHHCGKVPPTYLVFGFGDMAMVRGINVTDLDYSYLVESKGPDTPVVDASLLQRLFRRISISALPPPERHLVEFLLLLPVAALVICVFRNIIGLPSFGTFAPALIGLAFREEQSRPGIVAFVAILLVGWCMRRLLDRFHLLQVPRTAFMLSLIVVLLIGLILVANYRDIAATRYMSLFPMIILTGMIERFWTQETEDGVWSSFKVLLCSLLSAAAISLLLSFHPLVSHLVNYPETIGLVMAGQLLLGRYTGYRLSELFRFRDFAAEPEPKTSQTRVRIDSERVHERIS